MAATMYQRELPPTFNGLDLKVLENVLSYGDDLGDGGVLCEEGGCGISFQYFRKSRNFFIREVH